MALNTIVTQGDSAGASSGNNQTNLDWRTVIDSSVIEINSAITQSNTTITIMKTDGGDTTVFRVSGHPATAEGVTQLDFTTFASAIAIVPKNLNGFTLTITVEGTTASPQTYALSEELTISDFFGGDIFIQNESSVSASKRITQGGILDFTSMSGEVDGIDIDNCQCRVHIKNLSIIVPSSNYTDCIRAFASQFVEVEGCYLRSNATDPSESQTRGIFGQSSYVSAKLNFIDNVYYGVRADEGRIHIETTSDSDAVGVSAPYIFANPVKGGNIFLGKDTTNQISVLTDVFIGGKATFTNQVDEQDGVIEIDRNNNIRVLIPTSLTATQAQDLLGQSPVNLNDGQLTVEWAGGTHTYNDMIQLTDRSNAIFHFGSKKSESAILDFSSSSTNQGLQFKNINRITVGTTSYVDGLTIKSANLKNAVALDFHECGNTIITENELLSQYPSASDKNDRGVDLYASTAELDSNSYNGYEYGVILNDNSQAYATQSGYSVSGNPNIGAYVNLGGVYSYSDSNPIVGTTADEVNTSSGLIINEQNPPVLQNDIVFNVATDGTTTIDASSEVQYLNERNSWTTLQSAITALPRNLNRNSATFTFADGTHTITSSTHIEGFIGGDLFFYGASDHGATLSSSGTMSQMLHFDDCKLDIRIGTSGAALNFTSNSTKSVSILRFSESSSIHIDECHFDETAGDSTAIKAEYNTNIHLTGCRFDSVKNGVFIRYNSTAYVQDCTNVSTNVTQYGVFAQHGSRIGVAGSNIIQADDADYKAQYGSLVLASQIDGVNPVTGGNAVIANEEANS